MAVQDDVEDALLRALKAFVTLEKKKAFTPIGVAVIVGCTNLIALLEMKKGDEGGKT